MWQSGNKVDDQGTKLVDLPCAFHEGGLADRQAPEHSAPAPHRAPRVGSENSRTTSNRSARGNQTLGRASGETGRGQWTHVDNGECLKYNVNIRLTHWNQPPLPLAGPLCVSSGAGLAGAKLSTAQTFLHMKIIVLLIGFLVSLSSAYADMLGINIELSSDKHHQTLVSIRAGYFTKYNRDNITVETAAKVLHDLKFDMDGKIAVIHSKSIIPVSDLVPIFEAMSANHIELFYIQIGTGPPTGMDTWNHK